MSYRDIADAMPFFNTQAPQQLSGVVIHSDAVAGWPDLQVDGYTDHYIEGNNPNTLFTFPAPAEETGKSINYYETFKNVQIELSYYSFLKATNTNAIWQLIDPQKPVQYRLQKEGDKFKVYQDNLLRRELLSNNIMLCIFQENINQVNIHLRSEALHFGFEEPDYITHNDYYNALRDKNTGSVLTDKEVAITWQGEQADNVLDIQKLATDINKALENKATPLTADIFALEMILGTEGVSFKIIQ